MFKEANKLFAERKLDQAIELYKKALEISPNSAEIYSNLGLAHFFLKKNDKAITYFKKAIKINKNNKNPYKYLGKIFDRMNNHVKSIHYLKQALLLDPNDFDCKFLISSSLVKLKKFDLAEKFCKSLLVSHPNNVFVIYNTAYVLKMQGKFKEAIPYYKKTLQLDPHMDIAHLGFAKSLLATGNFQEAWEHFEYRFAQMKQHKKMFNYQNLTLDDFIGKSILIRSEWGLGDMMHFIRYAKRLKDIGAKKIIVQAHNPLVPIFKNCDYIDYVLKHGDLSPQFDIQIPAMSLPLLFKTTIETVPADIPYLYADKKLVQHWKEKLSSDKSFKIGICWHAKPIFLEENYFTKRSVPLKLFASLAEVENVQFYSLQKIYGTDQLNDLPENFAIETFGQDFDNTHGRFMDTAAVIENLDLIISADTSIVHLAGAMGKKVWVLIPYVAEWRWLQEIEKTPWYPDNMRLFRQKEPQNWQTVIEKIKVELEKITK